MRRVGRLSPKQYRNLTWRRVFASETDNILRHCVHGFKERKMSALRIRIDETWGEPSERVYEVRVY